MDLQVKKVGNVREQFKIEIEGLKKGGIIKFEWDDVEAFTEFKLVKN